MNHKPKPNPNPITIDIGESAPNIASALRPARKKATDRVRKVLAQICQSATKSITGLHWVRFSVQRNSEGERVLYFRAVIHSHTLTRIVNDYLTLAAYSALDIGGDSPISSLHISCRTLADQIKHMDTDWAQPDPTHTHALIPDYTNRVDIALSRAAEKVVEMSGNPVVQDLYSQFQSHIHDAISSAVSSTLPPSKPTPPSRIPINPIQ